MVKKVFWIVGAAVVLIVVAYNMLMRISPNAIPVNIPVVEKLTCLYQVNVAGNSMSPALTAGSRVVFDRCFNDKLNLPSGMIVAFKEDKTVRIARIIEKNAGGSDVIYKTSQDGKPDVFISVPANQIIAVYQNK